MLEFAGIGEVLSSPVWTAFAAILAAGAIGVSIFLYLKQRTRKALSYEMKVTELVNVHNEVRDQFRVFFGKEQVANACLLQLRLENTGNVPIPEADFERPLEIALAKDGSPLTVEVPSAEPPGLEPTAEIVDHAVRVHPLLLNPGDNLTVKVITRNFSEFALRYRIVGISRLTDARDQARKAEKRRALLFGILGALVGGLISFGLTLLLELLG